MVQNGVMSDSARGRLLVRIGVVGLLLSIAVTVGGLILVSLGWQAATRSIEVTKEAVESVALTTAAIDSAFSIAEEGLATVEVTVGGASTSIVELAAVMADLADMVGNEIPASVEAIEATMPGLVDTAAVIDQTMRTLASFGVDYDPDQPLDQALAEVERSLAVIPDQLRIQRPVLAKASEDLVAFATQSLGISREVGNLAIRLGEVSRLVAAYRETAARADRVLGDLESALEGRLWWALVAVVMAGGALVAAQLTALMVGRGQLLSDAAAGRHQSS